MLIDTHIHTNKYSSCSSINPTQVVDKALKLGLSGIVLVEHYNVWTENEIENLGEATNVNKLLILRGQEVICSIGHLLVYGYYNKLKENLSMEEILRNVHNVGGIVIVAHPFRNGANVVDDPAELRRKFASVDGIEVFSANQSDVENNYGKKVWETLGLIGIAGSDAHSIEKVGRFLTLFENPIVDESDLIREIRAGRCKPIAFNTKV